MQIVAAHVTVKEASAGAVHEDMGLIRGPCWWGHTGFFKALDGLHPPDSSAFTKVDTGYNAVSQDAGPNRGSGKS